MTSILQPLVRSSGNFIADRRFSYAQDAADEGDFLAAAELCQQVLELVPDWAVARFALAQAQEKSGQIDAAIQSYVLTKNLSPDDEWGAALHEARLKGETPKTPPAAYVRGLFDQYAPRFEKHLVQKLSYRGPDLIAQLLGRFGVTASDARTHAMDLGCGTGLCAPILRPLAQHLSGVDIAPAMVAIAQKRAIYDRLEVGDIDAVLELEPDASVDLLVAADVFIYVGDLERNFRESARVLKPGGLYAFTTQSQNDGTYTLGADMRYTHSVVYLVEQAAKHGMTARIIEDASARKDQGVPVPGSAILLQKAA